MNKITLSSLHTYNEPRNLAIDQRMASNADSPRRKAMFQSSFSKASLLGLVLIAFPLAASARPRNNPSYGGQIDFGAQMLHLNDGCASVHGMVTSGDFFDDLKRIDNSGRMEYKKQGKPVTEYPDSITSSIRIAGDPCAAERSSSPSAFFQNHSYALKLEVYWKRDMKLRPALLSPLVANCRGYSSITTPDESVSIPSITCELTVKSKGVPLSDHLIVSILTPDGTPITRISAAP
jgi:hypothetical protein